MTLAFMLDTNIVSAMIRQKTGPVWERAAIAGFEALCVSIFTSSELRFGASKVQSDNLEARITDILGRMTVLPFTQPADAVYGRVRAGLERTGRTIGPTDLFIAAHALTLELTLVTANLGEFSRVPGLRLENWLD